MARLEEICSLITDGSHFSPEDEGVGYPMFSVKDMTPNGFNISGCKKIGEEAYKKLVANGCKPLNDDVVVAKDGSYLKTAFVIKGNPEIALLSSIAILRPKIDLVVPEYLSYFLKSDAVYRTVSLNYITGTALKRIILKGIRKIEVDLPDIGEQEQRAQRLSKVDYLCQLRKQQLDKLDELVKARFVEMFGDPVNNPMNYPKSQLGKVCDVRDGTHDSPEYYDVGYPLVTSKNVTGGKIDLSECNLISEDDYKKTCERSKVDRGDIIMPMIGTVGKPVIVNIEPMFAIKNVALIKFTPDSLVTNIYIKTLLESDYFDRAVLDKIRGGTQKFIALGDIRKLEIILPDLKHQQCFSAFVERVDKQKQTVQQSLEKLKLMKKALMQEYFG